MIKIVKQMAMLKKLQKKLRLKFWLRKKRIEALVNNRELFEAFVYSGINDAVESLEARDQLVENGQFPEHFHNKKQAVLFRQLATPNFEVIRFLTVLPDNLEGVLFEYHSDKFTTQNEWKYSLGKLHFYNGIGKKGGVKIDTCKVVDFNGNDGKLIKDVLTTWGQPLVDFHRELFGLWNNERHKVSFFDASLWFENKKADEYYEQFLKLFISHGILFENFMLESKKEKAFIKEVFLPAFIKVWIETGYKPLIVSLEPTSIEGEKFWICHPSKNRVFVDAKIK